MFSTIEAAQIKMIYKVKGLTGIIRNKNTYTLFVEAKIDKPVFQHTWQYLRFSILTAVCGNAFIGKQ